MTRLAVITKSYAPDFELCAALNRSVLDNSSDTVRHQIVVPRSDLNLFGRLAGPRTDIRCEADFLPRTFLSVPFSNITINLGRLEIPSTSNAIKPLAAPLSYLSLPGGGCHLHRALESVSMF